MRRPGFQHRVSCGSLECLTSRLTLCSPVTPRAFRASGFSRAPKLRLLPSQRDLCEHSGQPPRVVAELQEAEPVEGAGQSLRAALPEGVVRAQRGSEQGLRLGADGPGRRQLPASSSAGALQGAGFEFLGAASGFFFGGKFGASQSPERVGRLVSSPCSTAGGAQLSQSSPLSHVTLSQFPSPKSEFWRTNRQAGRSRL